MTSDHYNSRPFESLMRLEILQGIVWLPELMKRRVALVCALLLVAYASVSQADTRSVVVAAAEWPGYTHADGSGEYLEHIRARFHRDLTVHWDVSEFVRARQLFVSGRADVLVGVYRASFPNALYPSQPLDVETELRAFYDPALFAINNVQDLAGKRVGWRNGYGFDSIIPKSSSVVRLSDNANPFNLLCRKKIDVVLSYIHNVPVEYTEDLASIVVLPKQNLWVVFQNNERGRELLNLYEQGQIVAAQ